MHIRKADKLCVTILCSQVEDIRRACSTRTDSLARCGESIDLFVHLSASCIRPLIRPMV